MPEGASTVLLKYMTSGSIANGTPYMPFASSNMLAPSAKVSANWRAEIALNGISYSVGLSFCRSSWEIRTRSGALPTATAFT